MALLLQGPAPWSIVGSPPVRLEGRTPGAVLFEPANADDPDGVRHRHNCRRDTYRARDVRSLVLRRRPPSGRRRAPARRIRKRAIDRELGPDFPELAAHPLELKLQAGKLLVGPGPLSRDH